MRLYSLGHSTRTPEELLAVLAAHGIRTLCDVRAFPTSRRLPHFARPRLEADLEAAGIAYAWLGEALGGYRRRVRDRSTHTALAQAGFRNYADHMESAAFREGIRALLAFAGRAPTAMLCAEKDWHRCHRALIADHLVALEGVEVLHLVDAGSPAGHRLDPRARIDGARLVYDVGGQTTFL